MCRLSPFDNRLFQRQTIGRIAAESMRSEADADCVVKVLIDHDAAAGERSAPRLAVNLQKQILEFDRVVPIHYSF